MNGNGMIVLFTIVILCLGGLALHHAQHLSNVIRKVIASVFILMGAAILVLIIGSLVKTFQTNEDLSGNIVQGTVAALFIFGLPMFFFFKFGLGLFFYKKK